MATLKNWWRMVEGSGTTVSDVVSGNNLVLQTNNDTGLPAQWVEGAGASPYGLQFDGLKGSITSGIAISNSTYEGCPTVYDSYTVSLLVRVPPGARDSVLFVLNSSTASPAYHQYDAIYIYDGEVRASYVPDYVVLTNNYYRTLYSGIDIDDNALHQIAMRFERRGTSRSGKYYLTVDGNTVSSEDLQDYGYDRDPGRSTNYIYIGGVVTLRDGACNLYPILRCLQNADSGAINGTLYDVRRYCGTLSDEELKEIYRTAIIPANAIMFSCNT